MRGAGSGERPAGTSVRVAVTLVVGLCVTLQATAQVPDSTAAPVTPAVPVVTPAIVAGDSLQRPSVALRRSLLVPGWGQLGNRRPARALVAAGAVAGAAGYLVVRQLDYARYRRAALFAGCVEAPGRDVCADVAYAEASWQALGQPTFAAVRPVRDAARGQRDVAGLILVAVYAVQALDAYVGAELADFDVGEDLAAPSPSGVSVAVGAEAGAAALVTRVRF